MSSQQLAEPTGEIVVEMADLKVSSDPEAVLTTTTVGSGVAVAIYDPQVRVGGLLHFIMPRWEANQKMALENPSLFANSGIPQLYRRCYKLGAEKQRVQCYLVGGADVMDPSATYQPGRENIETAREILKTNGAEIGQTWVGGRESRVVRLHVSDGRIEVRTSRENGTGA